MRFTSAPFPRAAPFGIMDTQASLPAHEIVKPGIDVRKRGIHGLRAVGC